MGQVTGAEEAPTSARSSSSARPRETGYTYVTKKNRSKDPDRLVLHKYDPRVRRHVELTKER